MEDVRDEERMKINMASMEEEIRNRKTKNKRRISIRGKLYTLNPCNCVLLRYVYIITCVL
jgi:hypothetical protein